ncbi:type II secretion system protein [Deinococcus humi]|uniref:Prepilin-type N-terminal cleavage/methylation domain-containing protein n=1 Tax=Deinococcus humi TaxID=662880 RepID=A0A7W8JYJ0_9DEIO|nr:type II secretion system protein [Deinococcus humi]MBB5365602.1 prepilin-type N-terminal cleavage/methylation domain-containing protein [Deinococcus humi]GGO36424.1 pili assembly chaperone [Deinococcus humi]
MTGVKGTRQDRCRGREQGFTIIEILVAIALLGILASVLTATMTGSLNLNRQSQRQLDTASRAQQVLESIRGAWADTSGGVISSNYERACAPSSSVSLNGLSAKYINLNTRAQPINASGTVISAPSGTNVTITATCAAQPVVQMTGGATYPMRRLIVSSNTGTQDIVLTLDVLRPQ